MARVTDGEVREILFADFDSSVSLGAFITAASLTIDQHLSGQGLSNELLKEIERWLAAHLAAVYQPAAASEREGDKSATYEGQTGLGLDFTRYGQQVKLLDPTGTLANLGRRKAKFQVV